MEKDKKGLIKATDLAKYIINTSYRGLSNLELQKTMYFVELDYYKQTGKHLVDDDFKAWQYGPVVPSVYEEYRSYGSRYIEEADMPDESKMSQVNTSIIEETVDRCSDRKSWELVKESHRSDGAWQKTLDDGGYGDTIQQEFIAEEANKYGRS